MLVSFIYTLSWGVYFYKTDRGKVKKKILIKVVLLTHLFCIPDTVLISVGFYLGEEKSNGNACPFLIVGLITVAAMVISEIVAQTRQPQVQGQTNQTNSNLIPFSNLNLMFCFGILTRLIITSIKKDLVGIPLLSIQSSAMLVCLLFTNTNAKERFKKRVRTWREVNMDLEQNRNKERNSPNFNEEANANTNVNVVIDSEVTFPRSQLILVAQTSSF